MCGEVASSRAVSADESMAGDFDFWRAALANREPFVITPDRPRPWSRGGRRASRPAFSVPREVGGLLGTPDSGHEVPMMASLVAACQTVLYRHSGRPDMIIGLAADLSADGANVIRPAANPALFRADLAGSPPFLRVAEWIHDILLGAHSGRDMPSMRVLASLAAEQDLSGYPLFQVLVSFGQRDHELAIRCDLDLHFRYHGGNMVCEIGWDTALYTETTIGRLAMHLRAVLEHAIRSPAITVDEIPLISAGEEAALRALATVKPTSFPALCLHELIERQTARKPDAPAVVDAAESLSYAELNNRAEVIAECLRCHGVGPDTPVGVMIERSPNLIATLLGVLKAGGAYLPIEPGTSAARVVELLRDSGAPVCLVHPGDDEAVVRATGTPLTVEACLTGAGRVPPGKKALGRTSPSPLGLCSIYYTSGSTGSPKGVANTHAGWVNRMWWMQERHQLRPGERVLHKTTLTFDDSGVEIFWPLLVGATVAVLPPEDHRDPWAIIEAAIRFEAVHLNFVPSVLDLFLDALTEADVGALSKLRSVLSSGEALRAAIVRRFIETFGDRVTLDNTWGATEVSIDSTFRTCTAADAAGDEIVGLGRPMANNEVVVLDSTLRPVPIGVRGELCIAGLGLARGYIGDPARTAQTFVPHPWRHGQRIYRSGDQGRMHEDGSLEYCGRIDDRVKIRGVRIELGEVEAALMTAPDVVDAAAVAWRGSHSDTYLAAYVVFAPGVQASINSTYSALRSRLTGYAIPATIIQLPAIPRFASGKLDRRSLPAPELGKPSA